MKYRYNPYCPCARCRCHGYMGPAILITIGVIFLLDQSGHAHWMGFSYTWPALLIVIGLVSLLEHSASLNGHIPRQYGANRPPNIGQPGVPMTPAYPVPGTVVTPPPAPAVGSITAGSSIVAPNDREVHNG
jgi:cell wall-active antibiotic response 4TMS protein YvqF